MADAALIALSGARTAGFPSRRDTVLDGGGRMNRWPFRWHARLSAVFSVQHETEWNTRNSCRSGGNDAYTVVAAGLRHQSGRYQELGFNQCPPTSWWTAECWQNESNGSGSYGINYVTTICNINQNNVVYGGRISTCWQTLPFRLCRLVCQNRTTNDLDYPCVWFL